METLLLSRIQFGVTIGFHFLFPPISIGLGWYLVVLEALALRRSAGGLPGRDMGGLVRQLQRIFAFTFAVGVASGIVMSFQFGANWASFARFVNDVFGQFLVAEVLFAFFAESALLGIYLFGRDRVPSWLHWLSILGLALAATVSGFWILAANSWMQTPAGYAMEGAKIRLADFSGVLFNPSMWARFMHTINATLIMGSFLVAGVCAYAVLKGKGGPGIKKVLYGTAIAGLVFCVSQVFFTGHLQAKEVGKNQPVKLATFEGAYETRSHAPLLIFGIPTPGKPPYVKDKVEIPNLLSWLFDFKGDYVIRGLADFPEDLYPPLVPVFASFHLMFYLGVLFCGIMGFAVLLRILGALERARWFLWILVAAIPVPLLCIELGWVVTEMGRQPWIVYGILRTADAVSPVVSGGEMVFSLAVFGSIYALLLITWGALLVRAVRGGPLEARGTQP
jgi:cytochrome d ubiquinol oxidase subunit I